LRGLLPVSARSATAGGGAEFDFQPHLFPFFSPGIGALAMLANFLWQVLFFHTARFLGNRLFDSNCPLRKISALVSFATQLTRLN
jgi:hypothetical protein